MTIGSFDGGWGLPTFILVLLLALKYIEVCLFCFPFCFAGVLNAASTVVASLANVSGDVSFCYSFPSSLAAFSMSTVFACVSAISGGVFSFSCWVPTLPMAVFFWAFLAFFFSAFVLFLFSVFELVFFSALGSALVSSNFSFSSCFSYVFLLFECLVLPHYYYAKLLFRRYLMGATRSGKAFRRDLYPGDEYSPLLGASNSDKESIVVRTLLGALHVVRQSIARIPNPSTPPPPPPSPPPPPPPPSFNIVNVMKVLMFNGLGIEDPEQFWFIIDIVWKAQQITDDNMKKAQLVMAL